MQLTEETCLGALTHQVLCCKRTHKSLIHLLQTILAPTMQLTRAEMSQKGAPLDPQTRKALEDAMHKCESISPGFMHEFVKEVAKAGRLDSDMQV